MTTSTKRDFSNYGSLAKMARRYCKLCEKHSFRSVFDHSYEAISEYEEIYRIEREIEQLAGSDLAFDITDSIKYKKECCICSCFTQRQFGFRLGALSAFGFRKVDFYVSAFDKDFYIETAKYNSWECVCESEYEVGDTSIRLSFINRRQVKD